MERGWVLAARRPLQCYIARVTSAWSGTL